MEPKTIFGDKEDDAVLGRARTVEPNEADTPVTQMMFVLRSNESDWRRDIVVSHLHGRDSSQSFLRTLSLIVLSCFFHSMLFSSASFSARSGSRPGKQTPYI